MCIVNSSAFAHLDTCIHKNYGEQYTDLGWIAILEILKVSELSFLIDYMNHQSVEKLDVWTKHVFANPVTYSYCLTRCVF